MVTKGDKRDRATVFRTRLREAMQRAGMSQSALARDVGVDRSTISQVLAPESVRLPNVQVAAECAVALGVSADWLLGLTDRPELAADLLAAAMAMTEASRTMIDERIFAWHKEAAGYKIRHVPAGLPDMLKTEDMLRWEYAPSLGRTTDQAIGASNDRLTWMRGARSDYEIALPVHDIESFAGAEGYYAGLSPEIRAAQFDRFTELHDQLYPSLRIYFYDAHKLYSAPVTIFGPLLAVIYLGRNYLAFRDVERVEAITRHFDGLVRAAEIPSRDLPGYLDELRARIS
ncbi:helix-turn-helix domain-containing protein [Aestuariibius sp. 2305UL40-4]|uniref:helix-turn-helix domain-containing protein n=1 Tax=Aestuariibius violaceus TaxID=3234132 RepID=UPI00345ECEC7